MQYAKIQPIIVLRGHNFVRDLGFCYPISVNLLQLMCGVITHEVKNEVYINKGLSYSQSLCFSVAILSAILKFIIEFMSNFYYCCALPL